MQLQAKWCFPPYLSSSRNSNEKRKPRKWVFILFTKAWGFEGRVQHGVQGMGTAGQRGGGGRLGPRSPFRTFCSFLNISLFQCLLLLQQDPSCHQLLVGPAESDQSPCLAGLPSLTRTNIDLGDPGKLHSALSNYLIAEASALNLLGSGVSPPYFTSSPGLTGP